MPKDDETERVIAPKGDQGRLITPNQELKRNLGVIEINVPVGYQYRLFKNGAFVCDYEEGHHTIRDLSWGDPKYTYSIVDARMRRSDPITAKGTIPGAGDNRPPYRIQVPLRLTYQLANIKTLLMVEDPHKHLEYITLNQASREIARLSNVPYSEWGSELCDRLQKWLQVNAVVQTGLQVIQVLLDGEIRGVDDASRQEMDKRRMRDAAELERIRLDADRDNRKADAQTDVDIAGMGGIDAGEMILAHGDPARLLELHAQQETMRAQTLGIAGAQPIIREYNPNSAPAPAPAQLPGVGGTSSSAPAGYNTGPNGMSPDFPSDVSSPFIAPQPVEVAIDMARVNQEIGWLKRYSVNGSAAVNPNAQGGTSRGYNLTVTPSDPDEERWDSVQFQLDPAYPSTPPAVFVKRAKQPPQSWPISNWDSSNRLSDVVEQFLETL